MALNTAYTGFQNHKGLCLLTEATPNGRRVQILLEELSRVYDFDWSFWLIDLETDEQKEDWFLRLNPNGRIPVLVDRSCTPATTIFESAAILTYLQERVDTDHHFGFADAAQRMQVMQWLFFWHAATPIQAQTRHFSRTEPKLQSEIERARSMMLRLYSVLDDHLSGLHSQQPRQFLAGNGVGKYTIADVGAWPHVRAFRSVGFSDHDMAAFPALLAWIDRISQRPAVLDGISEKYDSEENSERVIRTVRNN